MAERILESPSRFYLSVPESSITSRPRFSMKAAKEKGTWNV